MGLPRQARLNPIGFNLSALPRRFTKVNLNAGTSRANFAPPAFLRKQERGTKFGFTFAREAHAQDVPIMACDFFGYETGQGGLKVGDTITAKDPDGVMCGSYTVISDGAYGFLSCSGDDPYTVDIDEGAVEGDTITFFINDVKQVAAGVWREGGMVQVDLGIYRLSVSVAQSSVDFGSVAINTITVIKDKIVVTNDGDGLETYLLNLTNPKGWIAGTETGNERYVLNAAFSKDAASIKWDPSTHALSTEPIKCSSIRFTGDQTGFNVPGKRGKKGSE